MEAAFVLCGVLAGVHILEGLRLVPPDAWCFKRGLLGRWKASPAFAFPLLKGRALSLGGLLPSDLTALAQAFPFLVTNRGFAAPHPGRPGPPFLGPSITLAWADIQALKIADEQLVLGGKPCWPALDAGTARHWRRSLMAMADAGHRPEAWRNLFEASLDATEAGRRWHGFRAQARPLLVLAWIQFGLVFAAAPLLLFTGWILHLWPLLLSALILNQVLLLGAFRRIRARLHPDGGPGSLALSLAMFLSPPYLTRAPEMLLVDLFEGLHPLSVAWALLDDPARAGVATQHLRALCHPLLPDPAASEVPGTGCSEALDHEGACIKTWLKMKGLAPQDLLKAPTLEGASAFCPRCQVGYRSEEGTCSDCPGVSRVALS